MNYIKNFFGNYLLVSAISAWLTAQLIKVFTGMFKDKKFDVFTLLFSNGGMPSSHSATVCALAISSVIKNGWGSEITAIVLVMAAIVMIDASGVRYETGKQATIINRIVKEIFSGQPEKANTGLKELVGHTPFQVVMGALLGILIAVVFSFIML